MGKTICWSGSTLSYGSLTWLRKKTIGRRIGGVMDAYNLVRPVVGAWQKVMNLKREAVAANT